MSNIEKSNLLESVKNKSYFSKVIEWYCYRYLFCVTERSWLLLIALILLVCVSSLLLNIYLLFPIKKHQNFVRYIVRTGDEFPLKKKLSVNHKENEHIAVARYLVQKYVELYESYKVVEVSFQKKFIENHSTRQVQKNFHERMLNEVNTYPRKILNIKTSKLSIDQSTPLDLGIFTGTSIVAFMVEQNKKNTEYTVEISFTLSNIQETLNGVTPFRFIVKNYELKKL